MLHEITYILLDAARMGATIEDAKTMNADHDSLYRGRSEESLAVVAPYIFLFRQKTGFINWYMEKGWGDSWGILVKSPYPMAELHKHFRKFLIVGTEDNQQLYFRFYDPRVLRIFLPTCDMAQLREFFGPIDYFVMEDEDPAFAIKCWLENGHLHSQKIRLGDLKQTNSTQAPLQNTNSEARGVSKNLEDQKQPSPTEVKNQAKSKWNMFD